MYVLFFPKISHWSSFYQIQIIGGNNEYKFGNVHFPLIVKVVRHISRRLVVTFTSWIDTIGYYMNHLAILHYVGVVVWHRKINWTKLRDYTIHKSRACVDLFLKVAEGDILRGRPFNLQGGLWFFVSFRNFLSDNTRVRIFFFVAQSANILFQNSTLSYDKNCESDFFSSTKIRIFCSATLGIRIYF